MKTAIFDGEEHEVIDDEQTIIYYWTTGKCQIDKDCRDSIDYNEKDEGFYFIDDNHNEINIDYLDDDAGTRWFVLNEVIDAINGE